MPNSDRMKWPFPAENQDPWYDAFRDMVGQMDASGYSAREDRQLIMAGGGLWSFDGAGDLLSWDDTLEVVSPIAGFRMEVAAGSVDMEDGDVLYIDLTRAPSTNVTTSAVSASQVPSSDTAYVIAVRRGASVYFRHGFSIPSGSSRELFSGVSSAPSTIIWMGGRESHNSDVTPLVAGAIAFTPVTHNPVTSLVFRAVAANGNTGLTNQVQLVNVTDGELVAELSFTSTNIAKDEVTLTIGSSVGDIDDPEHIYEVRIKLGAAPASGDDTVELYSAELRVF